MRLPFLFVPSLLAASLAAQDDPPARWRIALGVGAGMLEHDDESFPRADANSAGAFRVGFEGTSRRGFGGGLRLESFAAKELDFSAAPADYDVGFGSLFGHFTYRVQSHRFAMPVRIGLLANALTVDNVTTSGDDMATYRTLGIQTELTPEFTLARHGNTTWTVYGEIGLGGGGTTIEIDNDSREWASATVFTGLELGTRVQLGLCELSLAYVGRWQSMDESDPDGTPPLTVLPYDANFHGVMFGVAVVF